MSKKCYRACSSAGTNYSWPGNVRELEHILEAGLNVLNGNKILDVEDLARVCPNIFRGYSSAKDALQQITADYLDGPSVVQRSSVQNKSALFETDLLSKKEPENPLINNEEKKNQFLVPALFLHSPLTRDMRENIEKSDMIAALSRSGGNASTAAKLLKLSPQLLYYRLKKYNLKPKDFVPKDFQRG